MPERHARVCVCKLVPECVGVWVCACLCVRSCLSACGERRVGLVDPAGSAGDVLALSGKCVRVRVCVCACVRVRVYACVRKVLRRVLDLLERLRALSGTRVRERSGEPEDRPAVRWVRHALRLTSLCTLGGCVTYSITACAKQLKKYRRFAHHTSGASRSTSLTVKQRALRRVF